MTEKVTLTVFDEVGIGCHDHVSQAAWYAGLEDVCLPAVPACRSLP